MLVEDWMELVMLVETHLEFCQHYHSHLPPVDRIEAVCYHQNHQCLLQHQMGRKVQLQEGREMLVAQQVELPGQGISSRQSQLCQTPRIAWCMG